MVINNSRHAESPTADSGASKMEGAIADNIIGPLGGTPLGSSSGTDSSSRYFYDNSWDRRNRWEKFLSFAAGIVGLSIGLCLLPVVASFIAIGWFQSWRSGNWSGKVKEVR